jgi:hypothetical protein
VRSVFGHVISTSSTGDRPFVAEVEFAAPGTSPG